VQDEAATPALFSPPRVAVMVFDGVALFELAVANDVFGTDITTADGGKLYQVVICGPAPTVTTETGLKMEVSAGLTELDIAHTVVVPPTMFAGRLVPEAVLDALRRARAEGKRILSLCTGAFVLAAAGILDGHTATTHWSECEDFKRRYPRVNVDPGVLYVDEGDLLTSAGSAASLDLCLHVVQRDYGTEIATRVARDLVVPLHRPGGQPQFIETPLPERDTGDLFEDTLGWLRAHLAEPVTVSGLAARSAMSPRTFARRFHASVGTTPLRWIVRERVRLAQRLLETSDLPVDLVARDSGFGSTDNLRKHFGRTVRTTPQAYRRAFRATPDRALRGQDAAEEFLDRGTGAGQGRFRFRGARDGQGHLVEGAEEHGRERIDQFRCQPPVFGDFAQERFRRGQGLLLVWVEPVLDAQHRRGVEQRDPLDHRVDRHADPRQRQYPQPLHHVRDVARRRRQVRHDPGLHALDYGPEQRVLAREVVVERAAAHAGRREHVLDRRVLVPVLREQPGGDLDQPLARRPSPRGPLAHGAWRLLGHGTYLYQDY
jgi:transcriptional regulator GlxA family with amidase domain